MSSLDLTFRRYYGPEFTARLVREWLQALAVQTLFIERESPWENGYVESFNGKLRDELLTMVSVRFREGGTRLATRGGID